MFKKIAAVLVGALCIYGSPVMAQDESEAIIHVYKVYQGIVQTVDPDSLDVNIQLTCNSGVDLVQDGVLKVENGVHFTVSGFQEGNTLCEVTETSGHDDFFPVYVPREGDIPPGFGARFALLATFDNYPYEDSSQSCVFEELESGEYTCTIFNVPEAADVTLTKTWEIIGSEDSQGISTDYGLGLFCLGGWQLPVDAYESINTFISIIPVSISFWNSSSTDEEEYETGVVPFLYIEDGIEGSGCFVFEETFDSRVEVESDCALLAGGLNDMSSDVDNLLDRGFEVGPGTSHECQVINTLFFEGIPTLSQYGLAVLALLMLGVGFVSVRRIV